MPSSSSFYTIINDVYSAADHALKMVISKIHTHASDGEGGQLDWDNVWSDAVHSHQSDAEGSKLDHGAALTGLTDDDHTQYQLKSLLTTQGDIIYATGASTWDRLAKGTSLQQLRMNVGATAPEWATINTTGVGSYGNGADGDVTINANTNLAADMYYDTLTVNSGKVLSTKGFRIFAKTAVVNAGTIDNSGGAGGNASGGAGGTAGVGAIAGSLGAGGDGGIGVAGGGSASGGGGGGGGVIFIAAKTISNTGTISANGGAAGTSWAGTGAGASNGTTVAAQTNSLGSAGGAGGNSTSNTGGGTGAVTPPAATEGGYKDVVALRNLRLTSAHTQVGGGSGGASGAATADDIADSAAGGSGGGGGGLVVLIYTSGTVGTVTATGGAHSDGVVTGAGTATNGTNGTDGTIIQLVN